MYYYTKIAATGKRNLEIRFKGYYRLLAGGGHPQTSLT
jgi:hypothetical protein